MENNYLPQYFIADKKSNISKKLISLNKEVLEKQEEERKFLNSLKIYEWESHDNYFYGKIKKVRPHTTNCYEDLNNQPIFDKWGFIDLSKSYIPINTKLYEVLQLPSFHSLEYQKLIFPEEVEILNFNLHYCYSNEIGLVKNFYDREIINEDFKQVDIYEFNGYFPWIFNNKIRR